MSRGANKRRCTRCHERKELTDENFPRRGEFDRKHEFLSRCKPCQRERQREQYKNGAGVGGGWQTKRIGDPNYERGPKPCSTCSNLPHRVEGPACVECGKARMSEPPPKLSDYLFRHYERVCV